MIKILAGIFLTGCAVDSWKQDGIAAGGALFDSKRLCYSPLEGYPPWKIEFFRTGDEIEAFISLTQYEFRRVEGGARVRLRVEREEREEIAGLFEGNMKVKLSEGFVKEMILALQEGKKVSILIDEWQETLPADSFKEKFTKLMDKGSQDWFSIQTPLK